MGLGFQFEISTAKEKSLGMIKRRTRVAMILRSLAIQATNNFERMLGPGFLFVIWPALRNLYPDKKARLEAAGRHLTFFNTHPYFANCVAGVVVHAEVTTPRQYVDFEISALKRAMMGAFGALGDDLFWAGLMPASGALALVVYVFFPEAALIGLLVSLIVYNAFHFWARVHLFRMGLRLGRRVSRYLKLLRLPKVAMWAKAAAAMLVGAFLVGVGAGLPRGAGFSYAGAAAVTLAAGLSFILTAARVKPGLCWFLITASAFMCAVGIKL